jgi:glycosyltransferase involved in cell wall biosynthesis
VLFFTDIPVGHHSGVGMWLDEMIKYVGKNGPYIVIVNPATEHAPFGFYIKDVNKYARVIGFRPSIKLFSSEEVTKDFPIDPTVYLGVTVSSQEHSSRSISSLLASRENRLVKPYSLTHTQLRALIDRGALGRPVAGALIQDGPFSKLGYGECKGYLDIPKTEVFVTIIAGFATERAKKLIRKQFKLPDPVMDYQPVGMFLTEALEPFRGLLWENTITFLNKCENVLAPPAMVDVLKKQGLTTNVGVFSRGVDIKLFKSGKKGDGKPLRFLYAGRLSDTDHGVFEIADIVKDIHDLDITIAGDGPDEEEFKRRMPPQTKYLGRIPHDEVAKVMGTADLVIVASTQHTHGNIYYEAIASGAVVLARNSKAAMEVVGGDKDVPFAKIYDGVEEARDFLQTLQRDPKRLHAMQKAARDYAAKNFKSWDFVFREQLFRNIEASRATFKKNLTTPGIIRNIWIKGMAKRKASKMRKKARRDNEAV